MRCSRPADPAGLAQSVAVDGGHLPAADLEGEPPRIEPHAEVVLPEVAAPAVVVPPDHEDRHPASEPGEGRRHVEPAPGDDPAVGEPEVEQVAVDEEAVPQLGDSVEKREERLLDRGWRHAQVGVGDDDQSVAQHGAKDNVTPLPSRASTTREAAMVSPDVSEIRVRVNYSETDQMGRRLPCPVPGLAGHRPNRAPAGQRHELSRSRGGRPSPGRQRGRCALPAAGPVRRSRPGPLLGARPRRPAEWTSATRSSTMRTIGSWPRPSPRSWHWTTP